MKSIVGIMDLVKIGDVLKTYRASRWIIQITSTHVYYLLSVDRWESLIIINTHDSFELNYNNGCYGVKI